MPIENNRTSSELFHENAYTNNTFSLRKTERAIRRTLENSYNYLKNLQRSYISVARFNKTEEDIYFDRDGRPCLSLDKDFIDVSKRKPYKLSKYYNNYVGVDVLQKNPDIFLYIPIVLVDGKTVFSYEVKSCLDGHTDIAFTHIDAIQAFMKEYHSISIVFMKNTYMHQFTTHKYLLEKYNWKLAPNLTGIKKNRIKDGPIFFFMRDTTETTGTDFFVANIDKEGNITFAKDDDVIYSFLVDHREIEITIIAPDDLYELEGIKTIHNRIDNGRQSCTFVIEDAPWEHYKMPIPTHNLIVFKRDKITGELTYENNKEVILHYPNIYEIMSDDVDAEAYDYKIYYFFRRTQEYLGYRNDFKYIFRYFARKLECGYEEAVNKLLYTDIKDEKMKDYFFSIFDYEDASYLYNHGDFFATLKPFDFDYKTEKMREFLKKDPYSFIPYAKDVATTHISYYLNVKNIDLSKRLRHDTLKEAEKDSDKFYFKDPFYVFMFGNERRENLDLRFFIDGIFCDSCLQIHIGDMDYIYIPQSYVREDSYIFIEKFESYMYQQKIEFTSTDVPVTLDFNRKEFIQPTLYDLFVTDSNWNHLDRSKFVMYALVDKNEYDVSDILDRDTDDDTTNILTGDELYVDPDTGEVYLIIDDPVYPYEGDDPYLEAEIELGDHDHLMSDYENSRLPLKYMLLKKLKIFCNDPEYFNKDLRFVVNKVPYISHMYMEQKGLPKIKLFNANILWKQDASFIRTFVNGRYQPMEFDIVAANAMETYIVPRCYLYKGDILTIDVTPFSYELECYMKEIPENFMVSVGNLLSKPFDHAYYDVYLNGRKLDDHNVKMITPDKIQFFNVKSRKNLRIFRRDRDWEYYGFNHATSDSTSIPHVHLDDILDSEDVSDEDKEKIIYDVIYEDIPEEDVKPGEDLEWDNENLEYIPPEIFHKYRFYIDIILPKGIARPNDFFLDHNMMKNAYTGVYEAYSNKKDRVVLRPNVSWDRATVVLWLGKSYMEEAPLYISDDVEDALELFGDSNDLENIADATIIGAIIEFLRRLGGLHFDVDPETGIVTVTFEYVDEEEVNGLMEKFGDITGLTNIGDGTVIGAITELFDRLGVSFKVDPKSGEVVATLNARPTKKYDTTVKVINAFGEPIILHATDDATIAQAVCKIANNLSNDNKEGEINGH